MKPEEAAEFIKNGMTIAIGGYTSSGYPKVIVNTLADRAKNGEDLKLNVITGANVGPVDRILAEANIIHRRTPMIENRILAKQCNAQKVAYAEQQMCKMPKLLKDSAFGSIDIAIVEALAITEEGHLVPTSSIGMVPNLLDAASKIIIEINTAQPQTLLGMHDIYRPEVRKHIPLSGITQRIGSEAIPIDFDKVLGIVYSEVLDETTPLGESSPAQVKISENLLNFLELEMRQRAISVLPPLQTGFGNLAAEIVSAFGKSNFKNLEFFCGGIQEANVELLAKGIAVSATCGSIQMTPRVIELLNSSEELKQRIILRNGEITNNSEVISRFAPITLTSGVEMDIYGNVNSSHISGRSIVNGIGGGANFAHNAGLSIFLIASEAKGGAISAIVPRVTHQDISEHDIDVIITEHGVADLRGKTDQERAELIINNCSALYQNQLKDYFNRAKNKGGHYPVLLDECFSWHQLLEEKGTMLF